MRGRALSWTFLSIACASCTWQESFPPFRHSSTCLPQEWGWRGGTTQLHRQTSKDPNSSRRSFFFKYTNSFSKDTSLSTHSSLLLRTQSCRHCSLLDTMQSPPCSTPPPCLQCSTTRQEGTAVSEPIDHAIVWVSSTNILSLFHACQKGRTRLDPCTCSYVHVFDPNAMPPVRQKNCWTASFLSSDFTPAKLEILHRLPPPSYWRRAEKPRRFPVPHLCSAPVVSG
jgi:hypothetical protein